MRDVIYVVATVAFFGLGALYIAACARILAKTGNIDEPVAELVENDQQDVAV